jgi:AcrR family transcriptional regulator
MSREESRALTKRKLRAAARELVATRGYGGVTVDQISETAGFSRGAFYSNYQSKDALLLELLEEYFHSEREALERISEESADDTSFAEALSDLYSTWKDDVNYCLLATEFFLHAIRDEQFRARFVSLYASQRDAIAAIWSKRLGGKAGPADPRLLAAAGMGMSLGLSLQDAVEPGAMGDNLLGRGVALLVTKSLSKN